MKLHTTLTSMEVSQALDRVKRLDLVTPDVHFIQLDGTGSRSRPRGYEIQLGTYDKNSLPEGYTDQNGRPVKTRHFKSKGDDGASTGWYEPDIYAASWHEWGWFMAEIFREDPDAIWGSKSWGYHGVKDFNEKTKDVFK
jgi:hypothetical protein